MSFHRNLIALALTLGCQALNTPIYFNGEVLEAAGGESPPVSNTLTLRFRNPTDREREILQMQTAALDYGGEVPWVARDKIHLQLSYRVTNTSDQDGVFNLLVDGASQYVAYDSKTVAMAIAENDDELGTLFPLMTSRPQMLAAGKSYSGLLREDDFAEAELDADALGRWLDTDTFAGVLINRSEVFAPGTEPIGMGLVPGFRTAMGGVTMDPARLVVPAFVQVTVNLQTNVAMKCEYVVRVRDDDDRLLHETGDTQFQVQPTEFAPPATM
jgi:hypothetical protein